MSSKQRYKPGKSPFANTESARWVNVFPDFIEPCHPTKLAQALKGDRWVHEIKLDGYRCQLRIWNGSAAGYTRRGHNWSERFKTIIDVAKDLPVKEAVIDGEVAVPVENGLTDFNALQTELGARRSSKLHYYAFDCLYVDGYDLRASPLLARKEVLRQIVASAYPRILFNAHTEGDGPVVLANACKLGTEGIVSKLADSPYRSGRSETWIKVTCRKRDTFVVVGFIPALAGSLKALYLGQRNGNELLYAGKAGTGFTGETARDLRAKLEPLITRKSALTKPVKKPKAIWVKPEVLVDVEYRALTDDGRMRHGSFKGVRKDLMD